MAEQRDPDSIAKEIEKTRAELAESIDAIAERISPKRVASRSAAVVKAQVSSVLGGASPPSVIDLDAPRPVPPQRRLRTERVLLVIGGVAALAGLVIAFRSRE